MPYRYAHWFVLAQLALASLAFWPSYLSKLATSPPQFHSHGLTAAMWLLLLAWQSWTIHHGRRELHRMAGLASLALFPLFMAGGAGIFIGMAQRFVEGASPFYTMYAPRLAWLDVVGVAGMAYFYFTALRHRRKVQLHARYMLATITFLIPPILGRLMPLLPPLVVGGPAEFWKLGIGFQIANTVTALAAFALAIHKPKHGRPFWEAGGLTVLAALLYEYVGGLTPWQHAFAMAANLPFLPMALVAALAGAAVAYAGWTAGRPPGAAGTKPLPA